LILLGLALYLPSTAVSAIFMVQYAGLKKTRLKKQPGGFLGFIGFSCDFFISLCSA